MTRNPSFLKTVGENLYIIHHIKLLLDRLETGGPEVLFFHGISLLGDVYPSLGDREMLDVDVLVRERDFRQLKKILKGMGLEESKPGVFGRIGFILDIHTSFLTPTRSIMGGSCLTIPMDYVFQRSIPKQLDNIEIRIPCPEHLFISTAFHLQSHSFVWDKGWEDLERIKQYYDLSDETILSEAQRIGAARSLYYLSYLRPESFPYWKQKLFFGERWILQRITGGRSNANFGDLLFLFQSKSKVKALQEIFFPQGITWSIIVDRLKKTLLLLRAILLGSTARVIKDKRS